jgi:hypothetical protein
MKVTQSLTLQEFAQQFGCLSDDADAFPDFVALIKGFCLFAIVPVHTGYIAAVNTAVAPDNVIPERNQKLIGIIPHLGIFLFLFLSPAEFQTNNGHASGQRPADFPIATQATAERTHSPDNVVVSFAQLFLPDRKNGLASVESVSHHRGDGFFFHFLWCH